MIKKFQNNFSSVELADEFERSRLHFKSYISALRYLYPKYMANIRDINVAVLSDGVSTVKLHLHNGVVIFGNAVCNDRDVFELMTGLCLALHRAVDNLRSYCKSKEIVQLPLAPQ